MKKQTNPWAVVMALVISAIGGLIVTWMISVLLLRLGISGFAHMVALMIALPIAFAIFALFLARRVMLN